MMPFMPPCMVPRAPEGFDRRDPPRYEACTAESKDIKVQKEEVKQLKAEVKACKKAEKACKKAEKCWKKEVKKAEKACKQKMKNLKKQQKFQLKYEARQCRREMKELKKQTAKTLHADVMGHPEIPETSNQTKNAGRMVMKSWKIKNVGECDWPEDITISFFKGEKSMVVDGYEVLPVLQLAPGDETTINVMLKVPETEGRYAAVYRLGCAAKKQMAKLRAVFVVDRTKKTMKVEEKVVVEEMPPSKPEEEVEPSAPKADIPEPKVEPKPFEYQKQFDSLKDFGFDPETLKSVLVVTQGDMDKAVNLLL